MTILEQAEELRSQAIELLLKERGTIDQKLDQLGYQTGAAPEKKNGRTVKCSRCLGEGHTIRTCKVSPSETTE